MDPKTITLNEVVVNKGEIKMIRYNVFMILLFVLILGILFIIGKFGQDGLAFFIFIIFLMVPLIVMYRNKLPRFIPYPLRNLFEDDDLEKPKDNIINNKKTTKLSKQIFLIVGIVLLLLGTFVLIINMKGDLLTTTPAEISIKNGTLSKIFAALLCLIIAGILTIKLDGF
jgi:hypothetical protein